jgi:hypothetical protein
MARARAGKLTAAVRAQVIDRALAALARDYIFPDIAQKIAERIRAHVAAGRYARVASGPRLAAALTADLRAASRDKHIVVFYSAAPLAGELGTGAAVAADHAARTHAHVASFNAFISKVERLAGNIGYLRIDAFVPAAELAPRAAAAMTLLADTDALIFDLRHNGGGDAEAVALLASYLFAADERVHLNDIYWRPADVTHQYWTSADLSGRRYAGKPVYVLASKYTFSAGEDFAYTLQQRGRATIVGEVTGGGAHAVGPRKLTAHFGISVPMGRSINPISKTNWEGVGVRPDLASTAARAQGVAYLAALRGQRARLAASDAPAGPGSVRAEVAAAIAAISRRGRAR